MYDDNVFQNLRFRQSTPRKREASVFRNFHFGQRLWKDAFPVTVFNQNRMKKKLRFQKYPDPCGGRGLYSESEVYYFHKHFKPFAAGKKWRS